MACPSMPYLSACGLAVPGGAHRGFNAGGRLTYFSPTWADTVANVEVRSEPLSPSASTAYIYAFLNGIFKQRTAPDSISVSPDSISTEIYLDAVVLPPQETWSKFQGINGSGVSADLKLAWTGDTSTEEYDVYHGILGDYTDQRLTAIKTRKADITVTNTTGNVAEIEVLGSDGYHGKDGSYTVVVAESSGDLSVTITDNITSDVFGPYDWGGTPIPFGRGLSVRLSDSWQVSGSTTFTVTSSILKEYVLKRPRDATHYFKVSAKRGDLDIATSGYVSYTIDNPPSPVEDISVTYVASGSVTISFTMPSDTDAEGWRLYLTRDWDSGYLIPHWMPSEEGTAAAEDEVTVTLTGLTDDTKYGFYIRAYDSSGNDDETTNIQYFTITASGVLTNSLQPPDWISSYASDKDTATITAGVPNDNAETRVNLYTDGVTPGIIDYTTVVAYLLAAAKDESGVYTFTRTSLDEGTHCFAVRCQNAAGVETNTHIVTSVYVYADSIDAPSGLTVTEVPNG